MIECKGCGHVELSLITYRDHAICYWCKLRWLKMEALVNRAIEWGTLSKRDTFLGGLKKESLLGKEE